jgi:hypothetical protein
MMDLETIRRLSAEAAVKASKGKKKPLTFFDEADVVAFFAEPRGPAARSFPNLGDFVPKGWEMTKTLFCDHSGFGAPNEPALTRKQLIEELKGDIAKGNEYGYGVVEVSQFQLVLGVFKEVTPRVRKK